MKYLKLYAMVIFTSTLLINCKKNKDDGNVKEEVPFINGPNIPQFKSIYFVDSIRILKTHFVDENNMFFIGRTNNFKLPRYIIKSKDGGQSFTIHKFKYPKLFDCETVAIDSNKFIGYENGGDSSFILYNTAGQILDIINRPSTTSLINDIAKINNNEIAVSFYNDGVYKYTISSKTYTKIASGSFKKIFALNNTLVIGGNNTLVANNIRIYKNCNDTSNYKTINITNYNGFSHALITTNYAYIVAQTKPSANTSLPAIFKFDLINQTSQLLNLNNSFFSNPLLFMTNTDDNTIYYGAEKIYNSNDGLKTINSYDIQRKGIPGTRAENGAVFNSGSAQYFYIIELNGYRIVKNI
jgi:hypothetical protein